MSNIYEKVTSNFFLVHTFGNEDDFARMVIPDESETQNAPGRNAQLRRHRHSCWLLRGEINPVRRPGLPRVKGVKGVRPKKGLQKTLKAECVPVPRWQVPPLHQPTVHGSQSTIPWQWQQNVNAKPNVVFSEFDDFYVRRDKRSGV